MVSSRHILRDYGALIPLITRLLDGTAVVLCAIAAYAWRFSLDGFPIPTQYNVIILIAFLITLVVFPAFEIYRSWRGRSLAAFLSHLTLAWGTVLLIIVSLLFTLRMGIEYSRLWFTAWAGFTLASLFLLRLVVFAFLRYMRKLGWNHKKVLLIGAGELGRDVAQRLASSPAIGFDVVAMLDDDPEREGMSYANARVTGTLDDVAAAVQTYAVDEVWIALPLRAETRVKDVLFALRYSTVNIRFIPDIFSFRLLNHSVTEIAGMPVLDLSVSPMSGLNRVLKAIEDRVLAFIILVLISPVLVAIAIGVKLSSPGPVIFKQLRHGWDGHPIKVYKFRTMKVHSEKQGTVTQATKNDARITGFGAFLRRTSLDELPQFFNVLQGRMSIVGPRPHALVHNELYKAQIEAYMLRHKVKPGITGWAQVNGWRGETDTLEKMKKRVEYDLYYIENWSLMFDFRIIALTLIRGFINHNAY